MTYTFLVLCLFFSRSTAQIIAKCGESVLIKCPASAEQQVQYRAVSWYKVSDEGLTGLLRWEQGNGSVIKFEGLTRRVDCPGSDRALSVELRNLSSEDSGNYRCSLWAPLGHRNRAGDVTLSVTGCPSVNQSLVLFASGLSVLCAASCVFVLYVYVITVHTKKK